MIGDNTVQRITWKISKLDNVSLIGHFDFWAGGNCDADITILMWLMCPLKLFKWFQIFLINFLSFQNFLERYLKREASSLVLLSPWVEV